MQKIIIIPIILTKITSLGLEQTGKNKRIKMYTVSTLLKIKMIIHDKWVNNINYQEFMTIIQLQLPNEIYLNYMKLKLKHMKKNIQIQIRVRNFSEKFLTNSLIPIKIQIYRTK